MQRLLPLNVKEQENLSQPEEFSLSQQPVIRSRPGRNGHVTGARPITPPTDLLYLVARDPRTLFLYWEVNWPRLFAKAGLSPREVHVRIYRQDGSLAGVRGINPFLEYAYLEVDRAGAGYRCELGCFEGEHWHGLAASGTAMTPDDRMSDDLSAKFATLPMHLTFQRMLESLRSTESEPAKSDDLAERVGLLQEEARTLRQAVSAEDWQRLLAAATGPATENGQPDPKSSDLKTLLEAAGRDDRPAAPSADELAQWRRLGEQFAGSSWGGASAGGFGGSSSP